MSGDFDAVIIGSGIIGGAIGLELIRRGLRTINVDRLPAFCARSAEAPVP
jgi:sarcosine oxidase subunit beta